MATETAATQYICPGEQHAISRSVHLSRLAAFYPKCRECSFRTDTGQLTPQTVERIQQTERRVERPSFFTAEGIRGVYMNELGRREAFRIAAALASLFWESLPRNGRNPEDEDSPRRSQRIGPVVVVGYDERPSSPDLVVGTTAALQRMTCEAVEIGISTRPCLSYAVNHLNADAGLFITGAGCGPSWTGFDIVGKCAQPWSQDAGLEKLEQRLTGQLSRPARHGGRHRVFPVSVPYQAGLWKYFHALRPVRAVCSCPLLHVRAMLVRIFEKLPCTLTFVEAADEREHNGARRNSIAERMKSEIKEQRAHLGFIIGDDAQQVTVIDERGKAIPNELITRLIAEELLAQTPQANLVLESPVDPKLQQDLEAMRARTIAGGSTRASIAATIQKNDATFAGGGTGRWWFRDGIPICDALVTIARVLQAISRSDTAISQLVARWSC